LNLKPYALKLLIFLLWGCSHQPQEIIEPKSATFEFNYNVEFTESGYLKAWIPIPQTNQHQIVSNLSIDTELNMYIAKDDIYRNTFIVLDGQVMAPQSVDISYTFTRKETQSYYDQTNEKMFAVYTAEMDLVPRDERFERISSALSGEGEQFGRNLYRYVLDHMDYDTSEAGWGLGDAIYASDSAKGNCTDYHSLFNAISRTHGMPARFNIGFSMDDTTEGDISDYHCWTEYHTEEKGWIPLDIIKADDSPEKVDYYGYLDERRIMLSVGRDIRLPNGAPSDVANFSVYPYVKIDGKVSESFTTSFSFKEVIDE